MQRPTTRSPALPHAPPPLPPRGAWGPPPCPSRLLLLVSGPGRLAREGLQGLGVTPAPWSHPPGLLILIASFRFSEAVFSNTQQTLVEHLSSRSARDG